VLKKTRKENEMFKKTALVASIALAISATAQADYQFEVDAAVGNTNIDIGRDDGDIVKAAVGGSFFFESVDTSKGPLSEAAFLDHASSVSAAYSYVDADDIVDNLDGDEYGISGRYVLDLDALPLIFEGSWSRRTPDFSDIDYFSLGFGAYITPATTVIFTYRTSDVDDSDLVDAGDIDIYNLAVEHLWSFGNDSALKLAGEYGAIQVDGDDVDDIDSWSVGATYYINDNIGFGTSFGRFDNFGLEEDAYGVHGEWFISEQIALSLAAKHSEIDDTEVERDSIVLGATLRF
jgi:hypothetical protein